MKSIVLTGMMGCGKSTIGKILAEKLNTQILEIDNLIESQEKTTISEIFKTKGEKYFRQLEEKIILKKFDKSNFCQYNDTRCKGKSRFDPQKGFTKKLLMRKIRREV